MSDQKSEIKPGRTRKNRTLVQTAIRDNAKKMMIEYHRSGLSREKSALMSGIAVKTLSNWLTQDPQFAVDLQNAWIEYEHGLIKKVSDKDPKYLLQNDFPERFKKDKEDSRSTQNTLVIGIDGYDKLAEQLTNLITGSNSSSDQSIAVGEAEDS